MQLQKIEIDSIPLHIRTVKLQLGWFPKPFQSLSKKPCVNIPALDIYNILDQDVLGNQP